MLLAVADHRWMQIYGIPHLCIISDEYTCNAFWVMLTHLSNDGRRKHRTLWESQETATAWNRHYYWELAQMSTTLFNRQNMPNGRHRCLWYSLSIEQTRPRPYRFCGIYCMYTGKWATLLMLTAHVKWIQKGMKFRTILASYYIIRLLL